MTVTAISNIQANDGREVNARYPRWQGIVPLPPDGLLWSVGGSSLELFLVMGDAWAQLISRYIPPHGRLLDIGCGCGRAARALIPHPYIDSYVGFDVIAQNIEWCETFIVPAWPTTIRFHHFDLYSKEYNPNGALQASALVFPCADASIDTCFAASLFTHLLEPDAVHYLQEIARVLAPNGRALLSIHNTPPTEDPYFGTETRIDVDTAYFVQMAANAGLVEIDRLDDLGGQQVLIFTRAKRPVR
jgi:SAM-dependent methyltransferase